MSERIQPRPTSVTLAGAGLLIAAICFLISAITALNLQFHEERNAVPWLLTLPHLIAVPAALFMLQGKNWARLVFWALSCPLAIWLVIEVPVEYLPVTVYLLVALVVALPNAHWYFTKRDFRQRLRAKGVRNRPAPEEPTDRQHYHY